MSRRLLNHRRVLLVAVLCLLVLSPAAARADTSAYGELTRFGEGGNLPGQLNDEERMSENQLRAHLIGADPTTNDVYVLDEPQEFSQKKKKLPKSECEPEPEPEPGECEIGFGPITRHFRLQEFSPSGGGEYHFAASALFEEKSEPGGNEGSGLAVEGVAVDPKLKRVYVLAVGEREAKVTIDKAGASGFVGLPVASTLFAFSTEGNEQKELPPAGKEVLKGKTKIREPILTGPGEHELEAQSNTPGSALLEPAGITVDPATGQIIMIAHEDHKGERNDNVKTPEDHYVLQRIDPNGEPVPSTAGGRYVDTQGFFKINRFNPPPAPNSPVVVGPEGSEQVYVQYEGGIARVPYEFASASPPEYVYQITEQVENQKGVNDGIINYAPNGSGLVASPYGPEGNTLYGPAVVHEQHVGEGGGESSNGESGGVLAFSGASGAPIGWTGGQNLAAARGTEPPEPHYACVVEPVGSEVFTPVAAGSEGKLFVLAPEFIEKAVAEANERETYAGPAFPAVIEFGPGGGGCLHAQPDGITAESAGTVIGGGNQAAVNKPVTFSSFVLQGDVQKVEWNFGDGTNETVTGNDGTREGLTGKLNCPGSTPSLFNENRLQCLNVVHTFTSSGQMEVTAKIYTDDLSTPTLTETSTISVEGSAEAQAPSALATGPLEVVKGQEAVFDGSASSDPLGPNQIKEYHWVFGDGQEESTASPTIVHRYTNIGTYKVSLTVIDAHGLTSASNELPNPVVVVEPKIRGEEVHSPRQSGGSGGGGGSPAAQVVVSATHTSLPPTPDVSIASASLTASAAGLLPITLYCAAGETSCEGTVTLRALVAGALRHGRKAKVTMVTLARGSFALSGASRKRITVRLSAQARALLARSSSHTLRPQLTIFARDPAGATRTTQVPVLVRGAVRSARKH
jgi:PKD repeat protein